MSNQVTVTVVSKLVLVVHDTSTVRITDLINFRIMIDIYEYKIFMVSRWLTTTVCVCDKPVCDKLVCEKHMCDKPVCDTPVCDKPFCDKPACV